MKKITLLALILSCGLMTPTAILADDSGGYANSGVGGGYSGPGPAVTTIIEAAKLPDDSWVTLRGKIIHHNGGDVYTFQDASGQGKVEIDREAWMGQNIAPEDTVELIAEIERDWGFVEIEVEQVRKIDKE